MVCRPRALLGGYQQILREVRLTKADVARSSSSPPPLPLNDRDELFPSGTEWTTLQGPGGRSWKTFTVPTFLCTASFRGRGTWCGSMRGLCIGCRRWAGATTSPGTWVHSTVSLYGLNRRNSRAARVKIFFPFWFILSVQEFWTKYIHPHNTTTNAQRSEPDHQVVIDNNLGV